MSFRYIIYGGSIEKFEGTIMKKLLEELKSINNKVNLEESFNWEFQKCDFLDIPTDYSNFEKNIYLKENAYEVLSSDHDLEFHYWLIQKWGGITSLKQNERNDTKIIKFKNELDKKKLTKNSFQIISSLSKIASFMNHKEYVIYDSRVIYALNWLLIKNEHNSKLFQQPAGRNKEIVKYDLSTIINLLNQDSSSDNLYFDYKESYFEYCKLIKELSKEIYGENVPYKLEMLLFYIAPELIVQDVKNSITISIG